MNKPSRCSLCLLALSLLVACSTDDTAGGGGLDASTTGVDSSAVDAGSDATSVPSDAGVDATSVPSDAGGDATSVPSDAGGDAAAAGDGIFGTIDGVASSFTVTPSATMAFQAGAGSPVASAELTAGRGGGATMLIKASAIGENSLTPGKYDCGGGTVNIVQHIIPGVGVYQATGANGTCSISLTSVGTGVGTKVTGTFTATLAKVGGGPNVTIVDGVFSIPRNQN